MSNKQPILRVRKDHTCRTLGLEGNDLSDMCDACKYFQMRVDGLCGRRPGKSQIEKCEKPWIIRSGITDKTHFRLIEKKRKAIDILSRYNYKVIDDNYKKETKSRLIYTSTNYRKLWSQDQSEYQTVDRKSNPNLKDSSDEETAIESASDLDHIACER